MLEEKGDEDEDELIGDVYVHGVIYGQTFEEEISEDSNHS